MAKAMSQNDLKLTALIEPKLFIPRFLKPPPSMCVSYNDAHNSGKDTLNHPAIEPTDSVSRVDRSLDNVRYESGHKVKDGVGLLNIPRIISHQIERVTGFFLEPRTILPSGHGHTKRFQASIPHISNDSKLLVLTPP